MLTTVFLPLLLAVACILISLRFAGRRWSGFLRYLGSYVALMAMTRGLTTALDWPWWVALLCAAAGLFVIFKGFQLLFAPQH